MWKNTTRFAVVTTLPTGGGLVHANRRAISSAVLRGAQQVTMREFEATFGLNRVMAGPNTPIIQPLPIETVAATVERQLPGLTTGQTAAIYASETNGLQSAHGYAFVGCIGLVEDIARRSGLSEDELRRLLAHRYAFPFSWMVAMPYGGATVNFLRNPEITNQPLDGSRIALTGGGDPVALDLHLWILALQGSLVSFLARTVYGHALIGSVLHSLYVLPSGHVIVMWVGAGRGTPLIAGDLNNIFALAPAFGMWPLMVRNLVSMMDDRAYVLALHDLLQRAETRPIHLASAIEELNAARTDERPPETSVQRVVGFGNRWVASLARVASRVWGGSGGTIKGEPPDSK